MGDGLICVLTKSFSPHFSFLWSHRHYKHLNGEKYDLNEANGTDTTKEAQGSTWKDINCY